MLASKEDLLHVKEGLTKDLFSVKEELKEKLNDEISSVRRDLSSFRKEVAESKADTIKWMFIFWVGQLAAIIAIIKLTH